MLTEQEPTFLALSVLPANTEGHVLQLLSRSGSQRCPLPALPSRPQRVEEFLPELASLCPPSQGQRGLLLLAASLPQEWRKLPWEAFKLGGRPLHERLLVVRDASWPNPTAPARTPGAAGLLNLFPLAEHDFAALLQTEIREQRSLLMLREHNLGERLSDFDEFFITAHGQAEGLCANDGSTTWSLPLVKPMPKRIWLLACNVDGAMHRLAHSLLAQGCRTVIAATGELSAPEMSALIRAWCASAAEDRPAADPARWLASRRHGVEGGAHGLTVFGEVYLDTSPAAAWNHLSWTIAHELPPSAQAPQLDDNSTVAEFDAADTLYNAPSTWDISRQHLGPLLLWLAEKHDHERMKTLEKTLLEPDSPAACHALASAARRSGRYPHMARYLALGLGTLSPSAAQAAGLWGNLANLLIDMNLPEAALQAIAQHQRCLDQLPLQPLAELKQLDWQARAYARAGRIDSALIALRRKRSLPDAGSGDRELAGLLYLHAWRLHADDSEQRAARQFATEAITTLAGYRPEASRQTKADQHYLLRALAAYAWASGDSLAGDAVRSHLTDIRNRLHHHDPGPWAFILIFDHLMSAGKTAPPEDAIDSLVMSHYLLEAAMFHSLSRNMRAARDCLARFQRQRDQVLAALEPLAALSGSFNLSTLAQEAVCRSTLEQQALGNAALMVSSGVLPL